MDAGASEINVVIGTNPANAQQKPVPTSSLQNSGMICSTAKRESVCV